MQTGKIKIILGCMFSGKTSALIAEYSKWFAIKGKAICINYGEDKRYALNDMDTNVYSHDKNSIDSVSAFNLADVDEKFIKSADVILINEAQFFPDLVKYCDKWCDEFNKYIVVSGLDGDFNRNVFGHIGELIPHAEEVIKLGAFCPICSDGTPAYFTWRKGASKEQVLIGGQDMYMPVCRKHYNEFKNNTKN